MEADRRNPVLDEEQLFVSPDPVPRRFYILSSFVAHIAVLALIVFMVHTQVRIVPPKLASVQKISGAANLVFNLPQTQQTPRLSLPRARRSTKPARIRKPGSEGNGDSAQILREHAKEETAKIMLSLKFLTTYGFSPTHKYHLPFQTGGEMPHILASDLPPHYEQFVTVEVTIDIDGHVADARVVGGEITHQVEQKLLTAVRQFHYTPATRDGVPIPSQMDLVIHIPS